MQLGSVPDPQLDEDSENNGPMWPRFSPKVEPRHGDGDEIRDRDEDAPPDGSGGGQFQDDAPTSIEERAAR